MVGQPVRLVEFQRDAIRRIYDNPAGTRRAIVTFGRKNAKTAISAFLLLLHLAGPEAATNSQLFSAAQSRDQAAILWGYAAKVVRMSPDLSAFVKIRDSAKQIICPELGTVYKALSAEASTAYGLSPVFTVHDELGQVKGPRSELYEALETASAAHDRPLSIIISTQAPGDADLLSMLIDDAKTGADPSTVLVMHTAPKEGVDPFSEEAIRLANPAFDHFMNKAEVLKQAADAKRMPSKEAAFRNLILNQRVEARAPFVSAAVWKRCGGQVEDYQGQPCYGALDLSGTTDLTSWTVTWRGDAAWQVRQMFWTPESTLADRSKRDRAPYDVWVRQGHMIATPGSAVDYDFVAARILEDFEAFDIQAAAFDRWRMETLKGAFRRQGCDDEFFERWKPFGQGFVSFGPALDVVEKLLLNAEIAHGMNPVLTYCAANAVIVTDAAGNRKLDKAKSSGRIDGMVTLTMASAMAVTTEVEMSVEAGFATL